MRTWGFTAGELGSAAIGLAEHDLAGGRRTIGRVSVADASAVTLKIESTLAYGCNAVLCWCTGRMLMPPGPARGASVRHFCRGSLAFSDVKCPPADPQANAPGELSLPTVPQ